jgi:hypothetical protein
MTASVSTWDDRTYVRFGSVRTSTASDQYFPIMITDPYLDDKVGDGEMKLYDSSTYYAG